MKEPFDVELRDNVILLLQQDKTYVVHGIEVSISWNEQTKKWLVTKEVPSKNDIDFYEYKSLKNAAEKFAKLAFFDRISKTNEEIDLCINYGVQ